jgi:gluconolactonase
MGELRVVASGLCFPEGPVAMRDGSVVLTEIERQTISRVLSDGTVRVIAHTGGGPNGLAVGPDGALYVCNNGGFAWRLEDNLFRPAMVSSDYVSGSIQRVDPRTGAVSVLYDRCGANRLNGPNDIVFDANGGFYFGRRRAQGVHGFTRTQGLRPPRHWKVPESEMTGTTRCAAFWRRAKVDRPACSADSRLRHPC